MLAELAGGKHLSDNLGHVAFILLLILSTPVGFHQFKTPGVSVEGKYIHTLLTFAVAIPSMINAFAVSSSLEIGEGILMFNVVLFLIVVGKTLWSTEWAIAPVLVAEALRGPIKEGATLYRWPQWVTLAVLLVIVGYAIPFYQQSVLPVFASPGFAPFK